MNKPFVIQVVGYKNRGKTTFVCRLIKELKRRGLRAGTIKHGHDHFDIDHPGKDTWQHTQAGAEAVVMSSAKKTAFIEQRSLAPEAMIARMQHLDFILIEGYKALSYPKVVLIKEKTDEILVKQLENVIAIASWESLDNLPFPVKHVDDVAGILKMMLELK